MESAKVIVEVQAGLLPGQPEVDFTKRWAVTSGKWEEAQAADESSDPAHAFHLYLLLARIAGEADEYARALRNPQRFNWVRTDWVFL